MTSDSIETYHSGTDQLASHLVGIRIRVKYPNDPKTYVDVASAFILEVESEWFLVTAGHVLSDIVRALDAGAKLQISLADGQSSRGKSRMPLPYNFNRDACWVIDEDGLDYGILPIDGLTRLNMERNGVKSLASDAFNSYPPAGVEYSVFGFPGELRREIEIPGKDTFDLFHTLLQIERLDECPPNIENKPGLSFFGRLTGPMSVESIKGMSGGPIFAIGPNDKGNRVYWLVAVQSCWHKKSKEIAGCLIEPLAQHIANLIAEIKKNAL